MNSNIAAKDATTDDSTVQKHGSKFYRIRKSHKTKNKKQQEIGESMTSNNQLQQTRAPSLVLLFNRALVHRQQIGSPLDSSRSHDDEVPSPLLPYPTTAITTTPDVIPTTMTRRPIEGGASEEEQEDIHFSTPPLTTGGEPPAILESNRTRLPLSGPHHHHGDVIRPPMPSSDVTSMTIGTSMNMDNYVRTKENSSRQQQQCLLQILDEVLCILNDDFP